MSVNKVIILGRLGQEPELKHTPTGLSICNFSVATSETYVDKSGQKTERTDWHRVVVFGKLAEVCGQHLAKGRQVYIEGSLQTRSYEDKSGQKKYMTEIIAKTVQFIGAKQSSSESASPELTEGQATDQGFTSDDIDF